MKYKIACILAALTAGMSPAILAQTAPGAPEENGLTPKSETFYVNVPPEINNGNTESLGVAITSGGDVVIGWEDDAENETDINYVAAAWTLYNSTGQPLTAARDVTSIPLATSINTRFLSYFRADGSPVWAGTGWGPKIKANLHGNGFGMGANSYALGLEVSEFAATQNDAGGEGVEFPSVQLLNNDGTPIGIRAGVTDAEAETAGAIRIGDWEYLANGNIVIVGESRQNDDAVNKFGAPAPIRHVVYSVIAPNGTIVKTLSAASDDMNSQQEMWHGAAATANGFAIRFEQGGGTIRLFDNSGNPTSANIKLADLASNPIVGSGGRGDGIGFHGNGKDAYALVNKGVNTEGKQDVVVTVINADGTLRYSKSAADDVELIGPDRLDVAIDAKGRALVVYDDPSYSAAGVRGVLGRLLDPSGNPVGGTFYISEKETPDVIGADSRRPRAFMRDDLAAVVWESQSNPDAGVRVVAGRTFGLFEPGSAESAGLTRIVPDRIIGDPPADALGNWEPYSSVLGNSHFLIEGNTFADPYDPNNAAQRYVVMVQPVTGGAGILAEGFHADNGTPFKDQINMSRQNGNPGRVAGDKRPGAVNYIVGGEASPHAIEAFRSDTRWDLGFDRGADGRYGTVQTYKLQGSSVVPTSDAIDAINGRLTSGGPGGGQIGRFGGELAALDNGNFVAVVDDRSNVRFEGTTATAVIIDPNGNIVKESFTIGNAELWSNVAAFQGGFAVRLAGVIYFYNNNGDLLGQVDQNATGDTIDRGRGDGIRIASHINTPYVFLAAEVANSTQVKVYAFDSRNQTFVAGANVSEAGFTGDADRVNLAVDALNRVTVAWVSRPAGYEKNQVAARVLAFNESTKTFTPLTSSFFAFINTAKQGIESFQMTVSMTTKQIMIAAKGDINKNNRPLEGVTSFNDVNFYTVLSHPDPKDDPTAPVGGGGPRLSISKSGNNITISWSGSGFKLQSSPTLPGTWTTINTTGNTYTTSAASGNLFFRLTNQ